ncbi:UTP--glucose-1-phosphate uridylyltransferase GalU [Paenibacillus sp. DMB20]|uniref:UTP--glucose-1-phosphate uridylyltransferase GalU n=1 Tax=Paenibacillus sp. DMB20 TaxID=1642570 RepID=UPI000627DAFF|nr:UTP--glucose-1-phosphate uridylyltransferase GalU [Paenibacillus sp. DMB20]KKO51002.1 UTP--glucose-1-phosphate uridylyltransferase [Paenibacillus sp. DMB20]
MSKIRKAIIPAAGLGTRFLPATKAMPKEMLPIVDKPTIQYIVEEAVASGIEDIIIVTGKEKRAIEDHFDHAFKLELNLQQRNKMDLLYEVQRPSQMADIHYIRQKEPKGLGHAVWCARKFIGEEPFAVLLGDDIIRSDKPCIRQLMDQYGLTRSSVIGVKDIPAEEVSRYGIVDPYSNVPDNGLIRVRGLVEKPPVEKAPSMLAIMGRYILTPAIFDYLETAMAGIGGEIQLTDAIQRLTETEKVYACLFDGTRYDVGEKLGYIMTSVEFALTKEEMRIPLLYSLEQLIQENKRLMQ